MTALILTPLDLPTDVAEHGGDMHGVLGPLLGLGTFVVVLAALVLTYVLLRRRGLVPAIALPDLGRRPRPEDTARQILAERFAHGDLDAEEFMERASALNWTPGVADVGPRSLGRA